VRAVTKKNEAVSESSVVDVRVPTRAQIVKNPRRAWFIGGGWIDSSDSRVVNVYWHRRQKYFTVYSLLQVLEHETLHSVLARFVGLEVSARLDRAQRSSCVWIDEDRLVFVNEFRFGGRWVLPPYFEEPTKDMPE
jgi:hypothetical protein